MARIIDKDTRIIDVDFGPVSITTTRTDSEFDPATVTLGGLNGEEQIIDYIQALLPGGGSFIQYQNLDLSFMLKNNESMQPVDVSVQRTSPVPRGSCNDGNNADQIEEYIFIFSRPLNNQSIAGGALNDEYEQFRDMGLDRSQTLASPFVFPPNIAGTRAGWPNKEQTIYAEKRMYSNNMSNAATISNGELVLSPPGTSAFNTLVAMPTLDSVTTWGSMGTITGPNLHCYRVIIDRSQTFPAIPGTFENVGYAGSTQRTWPPVNVSFLCKDPNFTEGEYLTRLANAMNQNPEGGPTA